MAPTGARARPAGASGPATGVFVVALAVLAPASMALGAALGIRWLLPLLNAATAWPVLYLVLRRGDRAGATRLMIWWALWLALSGVILTLLFNDRAAGAILNGTAYRDEMYDWLSTGSGRESTPSQFIPQHLLHAAIFCLLSLATGGAASLIMGAVLLNYMSFYVGDLILRCAGSGTLPAAIALAWNPWSIIRVVAFIALGVALAEPLLARLSGGGPDPSTRGRWLALASAGLAADIVLKSLLAPLWPGLLGVCLS